MGWFTSIFLQTACRQSNPFADTPDSETVSEDDNIFGTYDEASTEDELLKQLADLNAAHEALRLRLDEETSTLKATIEQLQFQLAERNQSVEKLQFELDECHAKELVSRQKDLESVLQAKEDELQEARATIATLRQKGAASPSRQRAVSTCLF